MHCTNCGNKNDSEAKFCGKCGMELGTKDINTKNTSVADKSSVSRKIIGIISAVVLFIIIAGVLRGLIGLLLAVAAATWCLKYFGVVSPNSAWVSETKGVKIAKYIVLAVVILIIISIFILYIPSLWG